MWQVCGAASRAGSGTIRTQGSETVPAAFPGTGSCGGEHNVSVGTEKEQAGGAGERLTISIWLLGEFRAAVQGRDVPAEAWRRSKARSMVKLLALAPGHRLHREQLMESLWPDLDPDAAGANLRKAMHFARGALGSDALRVSSEIVRLEAASAVDRRRRVRSSGSRR